ncbi:MAG TPA: DNA recombination protein RmuC [Actinobacteria bacterium]|nr:DNA recombination protein RmuC [Actinomycetota bacterium]
MIWLVMGSLVAVVALAVAVVVLVTAGARREPSPVELPVDLNREVIERIERLEGGLSERMRAVGERVEAMATVFSNPQGRGGWGELSLRQALEHAGLVEGRDYELNRAGADGRRPDAVVHLPDGRRIVVDAKFPMTRLAEAVSAEDLAERERLMADQGRALVAMARDLRRRGYHAQAAGGYVVLYLPDEGLYVEAMRACPSLFDEVRGEHVLLAGPATLLALLGVTAQVLGEYRALREAQEIVADARELHDRLARFARYFAAMGKKLEAAVEGYNQAVGSWESRLVPQLRRLTERTMADEPPTPAVVETAVRAPVAAADPSLAEAG